MWPTEPGVLGSDPKASAQEKSAVLWNQMAVKVV